MQNCFFATDLHGQIAPYEKLSAAITREHPKAVFLGGDLLPSAGLLCSQKHCDDFIQNYMVPMFARAKNALSANYPDVFLILGNDDPRSAENAFRTAPAPELWRYVHAQKLALEDFAVYGYACVPPTPFLLKDWEAYDVSRYVPPGCVSPEEGFRSVPIEESRSRWGTIQNDLAALVGGDCLDRAICLFHTPPYDTSLDHAELEGKTYDHVPLDVHVGSIAVRRFIENRQPLMTLHGHVHESTRLTGEWKIRLGKTVCINGAHDGPELALVRFDLESPWDATRELI